MKNLYFTLFLLTSWITPSMVTAEGGGKTFKKGDIITAAQLSQSCETVKIDGFDDNSYAEAQLASPKAGGVLALLGKRSDGTFLHLGTVACGLTFNIDKVKKLKFSKGLITITSEAANSTKLFKQKFRWNAKDGKVECIAAGDISSDPQAAALDKAEKLLKKGKVKQAITELNKIDTSEDYYDVDIMMLRMLAAVHAPAIKLYNKKKYKKAATAMDLIKTYIESANLFSADGAKARLKDIKKYHKLMIDYGKIMIGAKRYEDAIEVLNLAIATDPYDAVPFLHLGDAQFATDSPGEAKQSYQTYATIMEDQGMQSFIPKRVKQRLK